MMSTRVTVPVTDLELGTSLSSPIHDPTNPNVKLLAGESEITGRFLTLLSKRGITHVAIEKSDLAAATAGKPHGVLKTVTRHQYRTSNKSNDATRGLDEQIVGQDFVTSLLSAKPFDSQTPVRHDRYDSLARKEEIAARESQVKAIKKLFDEIATDSVDDYEALSRICEYTVQSITRDRDLFLCLGANPFFADYPARHSLHVCAIATAIGYMLGLSDRDLEAVSTGSLIHDVGMLKLKRPFHQLKRMLEPAELDQVAEHPVLTFDALATTDILLSPLARIVAYQIHERCDGSGYPRGYDGDQIHPLAKVAAVADTYIALVSDRAQRRGMMPYYALKYILDDVAFGRFDPNAVRGLLHAISLFPIGSFVQTNTGRIGRVVRSTGETYTQPVIELWDAKHNQFEPDLVNLVSESGIQIVEAVPPPAAH